MNALMKLEALLFPGMDMSIHPTATGTTETTMVTMTKTTTGDSVGDKVQ